MPNVIIILIDDADSGLRTQDSGLRTQDSESTGLLLIVRARPAPDPEIRVVVGTWAFSHIF